MLNGSKFENKFRQFWGFVNDKVLLFKYRNKPYFHYYRAIVNKRALRDPQEAVGGLWDSNGRIQLERLKKYGLQPQHTLLDIGCGSLRGGIHLIGFLNKGNYIGIDISEDVLNAGKEVLKKNGLETKESTLILTNDLTFDCLKGRTFDYIHAQSVFSHMPKEDIEEYFSNLHKVMKDGSQFFASFFESKDGKYYSIYRAQDFFYPFPMLEEMAQRHSLRVEKVADAAEGRKQQLVRIIAIK